MLRRVILLLALAAAATLAAAETRVVDLHSHSTWSDGAETAAAVVALSKTKGLSLLALTDHDQLKKGALTAETFSAAQRLGVEVHIGTEVSCEWTFHFPQERKRSKVHLLGYFADADNAELQTALASVRKSRDKRNTIIEDILQNRFHLDVTIADAVAEANGETSTLGRPHFAKALLRKGYVQNITHAFTSYLSDDNLKLDNWALDFKEAVRLIDGAGGVAVLAHPITLKIKPSALEKELNYLLQTEKVPLRGLEVYSSRHSDAQSGEYRGVAQRLGLLVSGGSDYHGANKVNVPLGHFGGGDASWRTDGWKALFAIKDAAAHSAPGHSKAVGNLRSKSSAGGAESFAKFLSYVAVVAVFHLLVRFMQHERASIALKTYVLSFPFFHRFFLGACAVDKELGSPPRVNPSDIETETEGSKGSKGAHSFGDDKNGRAGAAAAPAAAAAGGKGGALYLVGCVLGLQISYVTWAFYQERIMTTDYDAASADPNGEHSHASLSGGLDANAAGGRFQYSEFLVLCNRIGALGVASAVIWYRGRNNNTDGNNTGKKSNAGAERPPFAPYYKYVYAAMSNFLSSYFQYEALKYVSFPMQVLSKASKIIFTMLMGKALSGTKYPWKQYMYAALIMVGLTLFKLGGRSHSQAAKAAAGAAASAPGSHGGDDDAQFEVDALFVVGAALLGGYIVCDSFTSQWQSRVFSQHKVSPFQMMQAVNVCAVPIGLGMLLWHGGLAESIAFMSRYPQCAVHAVTMSVCSAVGQVFIFQTISTFGAVVFATIMTTRNFISVMLSIYMNNHHFGPGGYAGIAIVFFALGAQVRDKWLAAAAKQRAAAATVAMQVSPHAGIDADDVVEQKAGLLGKH
jgi:adenosine 3'-phospho 5'-phosphosulfate transporter B2